MDNEKNLKSDPHDQDNKLPKDVLNNEQDPESFADPISVEKSKQSASEIAEDEQKFKEAMTERD
jgi:hypothetical protein